MLSNQFDSKPNIKKFKNIDVKAAFKSANKIADAADTIWSFNAIKLAFAKQYQVEEIDAMTSHRTLKIQDASSDLMFLCIMKHKADPDHIHEMLWLTLVNDIVVSEDFLRLVNAQLRIAYTQLEEGRFLILAHPSITYEFDETIFNEMTKAFLQDVLMAFTMLANELRYKKNNSVQDFISENTMSAYTKQYSVHAQALNYFDD